MSVFPYFLWHFVFFVVSWCFLLSVVFFFVYKHVISFILHYEICFKCKVWYCKDYLHCNVLEEQKVDFKYVSSKAYVSNTMGFFGTEIGLIQVNLTDNTFHWEIVNEFKGIVITALGALFLLVLYLFCFLFLSFFLFFLFFRFFFLGKTP